MTERAQKLSQAIKEVSWDWENMQPSHPHTIAVATLREVVNQLQKYGTIDVIEIGQLCDELEAL